jgi:hypothetical protein
MALVAKGNGPMSLRGIVSGTLSNPVPRLNLRVHAVQTCPLESDHTKIAA